MSEHGKQKLGLVDFTGRVLIVAVIATAGYLVSTATKPAACDCAERVVKMEAGTLAVEELTVEPLEVKIKVEIEGDEDDRVCASVKSGVIHLAVHEREYPTGLLPAPPPEPLPKPVDPVAVQPASVQPVPTAEPWRPAPIANTAETVGNICRRLRGQQPNRPARWFWRRQ